MDTIQRQQLKQLCRLSYLFGGLTFPDADDALAALLAVKGSVMTPFVCKM